MKPQNGFIEEISFLFPALKSIFLLIAMSIFLTTTSEWLRHNCPNREDLPMSTGLETAEILQQLGSDDESIAAGMLHCYSPLSEEEFSLAKGHFGEGTLILMERVNKMGQLSSLLINELNADHSDANEENLRRMLLTMIDDVRVVLIKLSSHLQLLRNSKQEPRSYQKQISQLTLDVYAPLANRLGIWQLKWEMEDYALRYIDPSVYRDLAKQLDEKRTYREEYIRDCLSSLEQSLTEVGIKAEIYGRPKHLYSIWKKMKSKGLVFENLWDIRAVRVLVDTVSDCYSALGVVHTKWRHLPGEFDDYIATPKKNGYRSIHTVVIGPEEKSVEVQIRTFDMHEENELGVAAHWRYKENTGQDTSMDSKVLWLRQLLEWKDELMDDGKLVEEFKGQIKDERVYVFTPKGTVIDLPVASTPIDFAYAIHTEVGHRTRGAKINGKMVTLDYHLKNGDQVHIQTVKMGGPSRDWLRSDLGYIRTHRARGRIHQWFRHEDYDQHVSEGRSMLEKELHRLGLADLAYEKIAQHTHFHKVDDMLASIGAHDYKLSKALGPFKKIIEPEPLSLFKVKPERLGKSDDFKVNGVGNLLTNMANCCHPVPGDNIVGYITAGRGVTIHRKDCNNMLMVDEDRRLRLIEVEWGEKTSAAYQVDIAISAYHRSGLLHEVTEVLKSNRIDMLMMNMETDDEHVATIQLKLEITGLQKLSRIQNQLSALQNVLLVKRITH